MIKFLLGGAVRLALLAALLAALTVLLPAYLLGVGPWHAVTVAVHAGRTVLHVISTITGWLAGPTDPNPPPPRP